MKVLDPGHRYSLLRLDGEGEEILQFVKREGAGYPGNVGHNPGTNMQEVLRAVFDRLGYLDNQIEDSRNQKCRYLVAEAIWLLECRAADNHKRVRPLTIEALANEVCIKCGHVGCKGDCRTHLSRALASTHESGKLVVPAALSEALELIQRDPHQWSTRPCETCRAISAIYGHNFGCYLFAEQRRKAASVHESGKLEKEQK